jgi:hypothetical protein
VTRAAERDEAADALAELGALPHVADEDLLGEIDELGREVADALARVRHGRGCPCGPPCAVSLLVAAGSGLV